MKKVRSPLHYLRSAGRFSHLVKKFLVLNETQKCMALFKIAYRWTLSEASSVHFKIRFNIIFSSSSRSSIWSCTFRFSELYDCSFQALNACYIPHCIIILDLSTLLGGGYILYAVMSSLLPPPFS
jgi:hypothetical protein